MKNGKKKKSKRNLILRITMYSFILFLLVSIGLFTGLYFYSKNLNYQMPNVAQIEIYDNDGNLIEKINNTSNRSYVQYQDISQNIIDAFLSIEDKEYFNHQGINFKRINNQG